MDCSKCGAQNFGGAKFCDACGTILSQGCPGCGASNRAGARFCNACGAALDEAAGGVKVSGPAQPAAAVRRYRPRDRPSSARTTRLEGERKLLPLFADTTIDG
jgi:adenylate cyclase